LLVRETTHCLLDQLSKLYDVLGLCRFRDIPFSINALLVDAHSFRPENMASENLQAVVELVKSVKYYVCVAERRSLQAQYLYER
jgi:hypothetical protein